MPSMSNRLRALTISLLLAIAAASSPLSAQSIPPPPFYNIKLEPPAGRILPGWGQFSSAWDKGARDGAGDARDLASYERAMSPHRPIVLSFYTALDDSLMPRFAARYKAFAAQRGFFVAQIGVNFQPFQRDVSQGMRDPEIVMLMDTIRDARNPVLMRIGYEFNNPWALYDPSLYIMSFRRIVERLRQAELDNVATVWNATAIGFGKQSFMRWYPGDDVVDWWGVNLFDLGDFDRPELAEFLRKAREHQKPVVICEAAPVFQTNVPGHVRGPKSEAEAAAWYGKLANLLTDHPEIQAVVPISVDWRRLKAILPGQGWPDTRIERWPKAAAIWKKTLSEKRFVDTREAQVIYHSAR
jgi:hypothetical protein